MKIIIVGCGRLGSGLARKLCKDGHQIVIIDSNPEAFKNLSSKYQCMTVEGIGFDKDVLAKAGIDRADALGAFTTSDETNAVIARMAREMFRVPKVVARLYDHQKANIYSHMGIQAVSSLNWGIQRAAGLLSFSRLNIINSFGNGDTQLVQLMIPALLAGRKVQDITVPGEIHVIAIERENKTILPLLSTVLEKNDFINIAVSTNSIEKLNHLMGFNQ